MTSARALPPLVKAVVEVKKMSLEAAGVSAGVSLFITGQLMCSEAVTWMMFACCTHTSYGKLWSVHALETQFNGILLLFDCECSLLEVLLTVLCSDRTF